MARIKVTGYIDTEDLELHQIDLSHEMGLSERGYEEVSMSLPLDDVDFALVKE